jgi:hypothetical protein
MLGTHPFTGSKHWPVLPGVPHMHSGVVGLFSPGPGSQMAPFSPLVHVYCAKGGFAEQNVSTTVPPVWVQSSPAGEASGGPASGGSSAQGGAGGHCQPVGVQLAGTVPLHEGQLGASPGHDPPLAVDVPVPDPTVVPDPLPLPGPTSVPDPLPLPGVLPLPDPVPVLLPEPCPGPTSTARPPHATPKATTAARVQRVMFMLRFARMTPR